MVATVMQCVGGPGRIDGIGEFGQPLRLSLTPSWWYRHLLLWISLLFIVGTFGFPRCGNLWSAKPCVVNGSLWGVDVWILHRKPLGPRNIQKRIAIPNVHAMQFHIYDFVNVEYAHTQSLQLERPDVSRQRALGVPFRSTYRASPTSTLEQY